jgi:hypothetical protein
MPDAAEQTMRRRVIAAKDSTYPAAIVQFKTPCQQELKEKDGKNDPIVFLEMLLQADCVSGV